MMSMAQVIPFDSAVMVAGPSATEVTVADSSSASDDETVAIDGEDEVQLTGPGAGAGAP
jgi:uncharacterized protein YdeI (BOF family)